MIVFYLRDLNPELVEAWNEQFGEFGSVDVSCGDILDIEADAIISPANSFGYMDGGIDLAYLQFFGWELQSRLQEHLSAEHHGELPVGQATVIETGHDKIPFLVSAPTMRVPMNVAETVNAYLAFRAAIRAVLAHNDADRLPSIRKVLCPGLGTAIGRMPAQRAARQMVTAYRVTIMGETIHPRHHRELLL